MSSQLFADRPLPGAQLDMAHPLSRGLVGMWLLNENGGYRAMDISPYGNHGTLTGFASPPPRPFNGLPFAGAQRIDCGINDVLDLATGSHTVLVWEKCTNTAEIYLFSRWNTSSPWEGYILAKSNTQKIQLWDGKDSWLFGNSTNLNDGNWHLVGYSKRGTSVTCWLDGQADGTPTGKAGQSYPGVTARIGVRGTVNNYWVGRIGLVMIYNRVLLPSDIQWLYQDPYCMILR